MIVFACVDCMNRIMLMTLKLYKCGSGMREKL